MKKHVISADRSLFQSLDHMNENHVKFLVALAGDGTVAGTLTDGDIRRAVLRGVGMDEPIESVICRDFTYVRDGEDLSGILDRFQSPRIEFLPVLDADGRLRNIITRRGLNVLLLKNQRFQIGYDFDSIDEAELEHEIFARPWGWYKTTVLNDVFQSKVVYIMPGQALSLQSHERREEYWIIVNGTGWVQLDESVHTVAPGQSIFIPRGCRHRLTNTSETDMLIFTEVQLGEYFGEDDVKRYEDKYGRG